MRRLAALLLFALLVAVLWSLSRPGPDERAGWLADLERLERHTAVAYANLGERLASRRLSPRELDATARAAIADARSRSDARRALQEFVAAFEDAHFRATAPHGPARRLLRRMAGKDSGGDERPLAVTASGSEACERFGARDRRGGRLDWTAIPGFTPLDADAATHPFPSGVLRREAAPPLALLRIGLFDAFAFPQHCAAVWEGFRSGLAGSSECDESCQERFAERLEAALLDRLAAQLEELAGTGASTLLVDLTGNGGGNDIVGPMTRLMTARPIPARASGFIRHPHSVARLEAMAGDLRADLARTDLTPRQQELLRGALVRVEAALREASTPCDLSGLWSLGAGEALPCDNLGRLETLFPEAAAGELDGLASRGLAPGEDDGPRRTAWSGELLLLVDRRTASASEDFAASLVDAGTARVVGEPTMGVGCGYTNGGVTLELPATGLTVRAPDCVRFRADGRNEAEGVLPDLPVDWSAGDEARERAAKVVSVLPFRG